MSKKNGNGKTAARGASLPQGGASSLGVESWPVTRGQALRPEPAEERRCGSRRSPHRSGSSVGASPIVVDTEGTIIVGHTRGCLPRSTSGSPRCRCMSPPDSHRPRPRAYRLADNRTNEEAEWDADLLVQEFADLKLAGFDLNLTGFNPDEWAAGTSTALGAPDETEREPPENPVTVLGDLIVLGRHRLLCGDSTKVHQVERLLDGVTPQMAYNDPPYGIEIVQGGWVGGGEANNIPFGGVPKGESTLERKARLGAANGSKPFGSSKDRRGTVGAANIVEVNRYAPVIGDDSTETAIAAYRLCAGLGVPVLIFWGGNYYANDLPPSSCWIIWDKENTGNFADAELAWTNQDSAVRIFRHMWNGMVRASERGKRRVHPTQKPIVLAEWCFEKYGTPGDTVLDLFGGSGSSLIACERTGRASLTMELSPAYCDVIVRRWEEATGQKAVRPKAAA